jgi:ketosteroid isomerase-like protein
VSRESVRLIGEIYAAINRGDLDSAVVLMTDDVEYVNPAYAVEPGTRTGRDEFAAAIANLRRTFPSLEYSIDSLEQHGDNVVVTATLHSFGEGDELRWPWHHVWTLRDGKVCRLRWFSDGGEARASLGARPPTPPAPADPAPPEQPSGSP